MSREVQRERLLECAIPVIAERGYHAVRLRDIAAAAGVTTGMIQHYFDTREELLTAAMERLGLLQIEMWSRAGGDEDPWLRLRAFVEPPNGTSESMEQASAWLEFCAAAGRNDRLRAVLREVYRRWRELIEETLEHGVERGVFAPTLPVAILAESLILLLDGSDLGVGSRASNLSAGELDAVTLSVMKELVGLTQG